MKAFRFAKPLEYRLETDAEEYHQGDPVTGTLAVTNRDAAPATGLDLCVSLEYAPFKSLKESVEEAFEPVDEAVLAEGLTLDPGASEKREWSFTLAVDCPITTKGGSLFLRYGTRQDGTPSLGLIDLRVGLVPGLEAFAASLENHFGFEAKSRKSVKDFTEISFKPPAGYPTLSELHMQMRQADQEMEFQFRYKMKGLSRSQAGGVRTRTEEIVRSVPLGDFYLSGSLPNRALYRDLLGEVLEEITPTVLRK